MKTFSFLLLFYGALVTLPQHFSSMQTIEKNGMQISWQHRGEFVEFEVFAPTDGWVAIGFNESDQLKGTNLIMGAVVGDKVSINDRYIVGVGNHQAVETLKGINHLSNLKGKQSKQGTTIRFNIYRNAKDKFHFDLFQNRSLSLLIAYSQEDDFDHHSIMRTSTIIHL